MARTVCDALDAMAFPDPIALVKVWHPNHIFGNVRVQSVKTAKTAIRKDSDVSFPSIDLAGGI